MNQVTHGGNVWQGADPSEWLDYSANIRPDGAPEWVKEALQKAMDNISYYPATDMHRARKGLADYLELPETYVQPASGGASAIELATRCGMNQVLLCAPCFGEYKGAALKMGLPVETVVLLQEDRSIASPPMTEMNLPVGRKASKGLYIRRTPFGTFLIRNSE